MRGQHGANRGRVRPGIVPQNLAGNPPGRGHGRGIPANIPGNNPQTQGLIHRIILAIPTLTHPQAIQGIICPHLHPHQDEEQEVAQEVWEVQEAQVDPEVLQNQAIIHHVEVIDEELKIISKIYKVRTSLC